MITQCFTVEGLIQALENPQFDPLAPVWMRLVDLDGKVLGYYQILRVEASDYDPSSLSGLGSTPEHYAEMPLLVADLGQDEPLDEDGE